LNTHNLPLLLATLGAVGCGDVARSVGDLGHVEYALNTRYLLPEGELRDLALVVGHEQSMNLDLTEQGEKRVDDEDALRHTVAPSRHADIPNDSFPSISLVVERAGTYTLTTFENDRTIDRIDLEFEVPDDLSVHTWIKEPGADDFESQGDQRVMVVRQGAQLSLLPIPLKDGERLTGDIQVEITADPPTAVVAAAHVWSVTEQNVAWTESNTDLVVVGLGEVKLTIEDVPNALRVTRTLDVRAP
jgi:hypothetical protein